MAFDPPIIDNFSGGNDADINGRVAVPGGQTWTSPRADTHFAMPIVSGVLQGGAGEERDAVISSQTYGPNVQVAATMATFNDPRLMYLQARQQQTSWPAPSTGRSNFSITISSNTAVTVRRTVLGTTTDLGTISPGLFTWASGHKVGMELLESGGTTVISVYYDTGSGWALYGSPIVDSDGSRPVTAGYVSIELEDTSSTWDDFRVQTIGTPVTLNTTVNF